jgi:hypothetical protein
MAAPSSITGTRLRLVVYHRLDVAKPVAQSARILSMRPDVDPADRQLSTIWVGGTGAPVVSETPADLAREVAHLLHELRPDFTALGAAWSQLAWNAKGVRCRCLTHHGRALPSPEPSGSEGTLAQSPLKSA